METDCQFLQGFCTRISMPKTSHKTSDGWMLSPVPTCFWVDCLVVWSSWDWPAGPPSQIGRNLPTDIITALMYVDIILIQYYIGWTLLDLHILTTFHRKTRYYSIHMFTSSSSLDVTHICDVTFFNPTKSNEKWRKTWLFRIYRGLYYPVLWWLE